MAAIGGLNFTLPSNPTQTLDQISKLDGAAQQIALAKYQEQNQLRQQMAAFISNYLKSNHDTAMQIIGNMR